MKVSRRLFSVLLWALAAPAIAQDGPSITIHVTPESGVEFVTPTVTWEARGVQSCTATGAWSGPKPLSGTETLPRIDRSAVYGLVCVTKDGRVVLGWTPPTQNTNGTPLTDLAGFKVYTSPTRMALGSMQPAVIEDPSVTHHIIEDAPIGELWLAVTAFNASGIESEFSEAVSRSITQTSLTAEKSVEVKTRPNPPTATAIVNGTP